MAAWKHKVVRALLPTDAAGLDDGRPLVLRIALAMALRQTRRLLLLLLLLLLP